MSLFDDLSPANAGFSGDDDPSRPLAERLRPRSLDDYVGQQHLLAPGKPLRRQIESDQLRSMILWGPPGTGKTSLARLIATLTKVNFVPFSAVMGGTKEIKEVMATAEKLRGYGQRTVVFVDEIHRFNKAQQDAFLPYVEKGDIVLIGATTENPAFEVNGALLSRARVYRLEPLELPVLESLLQRGLKLLKKQGSADLLSFLAQQAAGDARTALGLLELLAATSDDTDLTLEQAKNLPGTHLPLYDKSGEEHFNLISALQKSIRSSDPDAALYWLARMLEGGEDRAYLARRLVRTAIEDIGLADPRAVEQAMACWQTVHFLGVPEGDLALAQAVIYLAVAPKSNASYQALNQIRGMIGAGETYPVPLHLRNAPSTVMAQWGYGTGYEDAHKEGDGVGRMQCLPDALVGRNFYNPTDRGLEARIKERLEELKRRKGTAAGSR
jgi:putative ATPase